MRQANADFTGHLEKCASEQLLTELITTEVQVTLHDNSNAQALGLASFNFSGLGVTVQNN
jgi:hypothetical protein